MIFLTEEDFKQVATSDELEALHDANPATLDSCERSTIEYFKGFLRDRFDMSTEFEKTEDDRSSVLVLFMCDYSIWTLLANSPDRFISEARIQRKKDVDDWLAKCQNGKVNPGFADLIDDSGDSISIGMSYGSNEKASSNW